MEAPRFLGALKKNRIRLESFLLHAESPAAAAGFYCIVSRRGCGVPDVQNPWWQHLHVALLVFALNPVELGASVITGFQCHPCSSARVLSLPLSADVPAVVSAGCTSPRCCWVIHLPMEGAWELLACLQSSLPALALSLEEQQTLRSCCSCFLSLVRAHIKCAVLALPPSSCPCLWCVSLFPQPEQGWFVLCFASQLRRSLGCEGEAAAPKD